MPTGLLPACELAGLAVGLVLAAVRAVLLQFHPVRVVTPVLARDVVAVLALLAGQGDLRPHIGGSHEGVPFSRADPRRQARGTGERPSSGRNAGDGTSIPAAVAGCRGGTSEAAGVLVAEAGLEPATQRL